MATPVTATILEGFPSNTGIVAFTAPVKVNTFVFDRSLGTGGGVAPTRPTTGFLYPRRDC